ncbi:MAG: hypothetical protein ACRDDH_18080 [Cetobacterium sp.]|uniref:hypothetical protein n=1 Tax=Cetobacterium sp. TaxID=2071632 RepID=UPI003EE55786
MTQYRSPLNSEIFKELTGLELSPIKLQLGWELLVSYLGYNPILETYTETINTSSNTIVPHIPNVEKILKVTVENNQIEHAFASGEIVLKLSDLTKTCYDFPYETLKRKIGIEYTAGFKDTELPLAFYLGVKELLEMAEETGGDLVSYKIDTITETYANVDRGKKINKLLGAYRIERIF